MSESNQTNAADSTSGRQAPAIRVSDAEREMVVDKLRTAHVEGRLTLEEMSGRVEAAYAARFASDLEPLLADLPQERAPGPTPALAGAPVPARATESVIAIFGGADRRGRWRVPLHSRVVAIFGGVQLDLREAQLSAPEVSMSLVVAFGGVEIVVPEGVEVQLSGLALFGGKSARVPPAPPGAPVLHINAKVVFGGVEVKARARRALPSSKD